MASLATRLFFFVLFCHLNLFHLCESLPSIYSSDHLTDRLTKQSHSKETLSIISRGVDDVGPALANATQSALNQAQQILDEYTSIVNGISIPIGLAVSFFGYFLLSPVLFLSAFLTGGGASFIAVSTILNDLNSSTESLTDSAIVQTPTVAWISIGAMLLGGALFGFLAVRALPLGMFTIGASLGVICSISIRTSLIPKLFPKDPKTAFIITAVVLGLIFGILALIFQKQMLIFSTAFTGSFAFVFGIGHFIGHFPSVNDIQQGHIMTNWWVLLYLFITLIIGFIGMLFQLWLARDKQMPEYAPYDRSRRFPSRNRRRHRYHQAYSDDEYDDYDDDNHDDWNNQNYDRRRNRDNRPPPRHSRKNQKRNPANPPTEMQQMSGFPSNGVVNGPNGQMVQPIYVMAQPPTMQQQQPQQQYQQVYPQQPVYTNTNGDRTVVGNAQNATSKKTESKSANPFDNTNMNGAEKQDYNVNDNGFEDELAMMGSLEDQNNNMHSNGHENRIIERERRRRIDNRINIDSNGGLEEDQPKTTESNNVPTSPSTLVDVTLNEDNSKEMSQIKL